jgi:hypothetical protein
MRWGFLLVPVIVMLAVGWFNVSVIQANCLIPTPNQSCGIDASQTVFSNPLSWLLSGLQPPGTSATSVSCGAYIPFTNICIPTIQQVGAAILGSLQKAGAGSILFGLLGFAMIMFAIFGNLQIAGSGLNLTDSNTRLLVAMGFGYMLWSALTNGSIIGTVMFDIPGGFGYIIMAILTFFYSIGLYDLGRTFT